ncbi:MAG: hypothetical protein ACK5DE_10130 [Bacteroidota bacterium]|jgi:hypothetical protein
MTNVTTLPINQALYVAGLQSPNYMDMVISRDYRRNVLTQLATLMGPSKSTPDPKITVASVGNLSIFSDIVAAPTASGTELTITVANGNGFRAGDVLLDKFNVRGRVKTVSGNTIVLTSMESTLTTSNFAVGHTAKVGWDASINRNSTGKSGINYIPETDFTYCAVTRESGHQSRRDRQKSDIMWKGNFWHTSWMDTTMNRFSKSLEMKYAFQKRGVYYDADGNEYYQTDGVHEAIKRNGTYFPLSAELTLSDFNDILRDQRRKTSGGGKQVLLMGIEALGNLQLLLGDKYIQYVGGGNTLGGAAVKGIDIYKYNYVGLEADFVVWDLLDDEVFQSELSSITGKPRRSSSIYFLNLAPVEAADGTGSMSPLQRYHFNEDEMIVGFTPGMTGLTGSTPSQVKEAIAAGPASLAVNDVDSTSFHILSDTGLYLIADNCALVELQS